MIKNEFDVSLPLAVWLLHDTYDYVDAEKYISVTTLMKPIKQIVLGSRIKPEDRDEDVTDYIARALGNSVHDSIEKAWKDGYQRSLRLLGYPSGVIDRIKVNPDPAEVTEDDIPVYLEQRQLRKFNGWTIGGKFDMVTEGIVNDTKSTSAFGWVYGTRDEEHRLQGSLYRWIDAGQKHPVITASHMRVNYIFTDWQKASARSNPNYPQKRVEHKDITLSSIERTEAWIENRLSLVQRYLTAPENQIPDCTDEELWMSAPKYKYFADPNKTDGRSTKNFDDLSEANAFMVSKGGKGIVITVPGIPKRCDYCQAALICSQRKRYFPND